MATFKIEHGKINPATWLKKNVKNISHKISKLMSSLKNIKASPTPLQRMPTTNNLNISQPKYRLVKDETRGGYSLKEVQPEQSHSFSSAKGGYAFPTTANKSLSVVNTPVASGEKGSERQHAKKTNPVISAQLMDKLIAYKEITNQVYFASEQLPDAKSRDVIYDAEEEVFPLILEAFNDKKGLDIIYATDIKKISAFITDKAWHGRQQFIYQGDFHSLFVDMYKDPQGHTSIISIDTLQGGGEASTESVMANHFNTCSVPEGKLSFSSLKTNAQKNYLGCKYFNMHFAKTAAKDNAIMDMHHTQIKHTAEQAAQAIKNLKPGESREQPPHPHRFISAEDTPLLLNSRYYKHSHSSRRLDALTDERKDEKIFKGLNVIDRSNKFRVHKSNMVEEFDEKAGVIKQTAKELTFSNSLDYFRRSRIDEAEAYFKPFVAHNAM